MTALEIVVAKLGIGKTTAAKLLEKNEAAAKKIVEDPTLTDVQILDLLKANE